jgi:two-component system, OmpR family, response regulator
MAEMQAPTETRGRILVVDDEPAITDLLATALRYTGYAVQTAATGSEALEQASRSAPDLIVLDVMLPDIDGFEVCRRLRADGDFVPVIFLTARDAEDDRVTGFVRGGDDYVTKPFSLQELTLRINALLRRARPAERQSARLRYRDLELDEERFQVWRAATSCGSRRPNSGCCAT